MFRFLLLFEFLLFSLWCSGQSSLLHLMVKVTGDVSCTGINVKLYNNGKILQQKEVKKTGKIEFNDLMQGEEYEILLTKKGMVSKTIVIDDKTGYFPEENDVSIQIDVEMIQKVNFVDYAIITDSPVGKMGIDPQSGILSWSSHYNEKRKREIDAFLLTVGELSIRNEDQYRRLLDKAEELIIEENTSEAENYLNQALAIETSTRLEELQIKLQQSIEQKETESEMITKIFHLADSLFAAGELDRALTYYKRVTRLAPGNTKATDQIELINAMLLANALPDTTQRMVKTSTAQIIENAQKAQQRRVSIAMDYQPQSYNGRERNVYSFEPTTVKDCCSLSLKQRMEKNCTCEND